MWRRYRQRRCGLALLGVSLLWIFVIAVVVRMVYVREARQQATHSTKKWLNVPIRTRQGLLPIRVGDLETLKTTPMENWSDGQRGLLNITKYPRVEPGRSRNRVPPLRMRKGVLPIAAGDVEMLKTIPLEIWSEEQRGLLNVTFRPWLPTASDCAQLKTGFSHHLPTVGLVSLPSSGNTWLRFLLEGGSGVFTGSLYSDLTIAKAGMYGELVPHDSGTTIAQKTHGFTTLEGVTASPNEQRHRYAHVRELGCRAVLLVRDPAAAIVSHRHLDAAGHLGFAPQSHFEGDGWQEFVEEKAEFWYSLYAAWIEQCPSNQLLVVQYERLKSQLTKELERVLRFLGVTPEAERMSCIERYPRGSMQRRTKVNSTGTAEPLTPKQRELVRNSVKRLHRLVSSHGLGDGIADYL